MSKKYTCNKCGRFGVCAFNFNKMEFKPSNGDTSKLKHTEEHGWIELWPDCDTWDVSICQDETGRLYQEYLVDKAIEELLGE